MLRAAGRPAGVSTLVTASLLLLVASPAAAQFVKIDDFESYTLGLIDGQSDGSGTWTAASNLVVEAEPSVGNLVLNVGDTSPETNSFNTDSNLLLADGATGTLFFRVQRAAEDVIGHVVFGLSDVASPGAWGDYEASLGDRSQQRGPVTTGTLEVRTGGAYNPVDFDIPPGEWINLWMVIDNAADTFEVYAQSDTKYPQQTLLDDDTGTTAFAFRNGTTAPLSTFLLRTGVEHAGPFYLDDVYMDPAGVNLDLALDPDTLPVPGDFNGDRVVNSADYDILVNNLGGHLDGVVGLTDGDINRDGLVDLDDFGEFKVLFPGALAQATAIPEPAGVMLLVLAAAILALGQLRKSRGEWT
jgi:hypothetical protein